jgi:hypothetical protein
MENQITESLIEVFLKRVMEIEERSGSTKSDRLDEIKKIIIELCVEEQSL